MASTNDGVAGARTNSFPIVDLANTAPTGTGATNEIVMTWSDARNGLNHEQALVQFSSNQGVTWSTPVNGAESSDRPDFPAVASTTFGAAVWNDARNAADCAAIDAYRQSLLTSSPLPAPAPGTACPPTFGNTDIFGGSSSV